MIQDKCKDGDGGNLGTLIVRNNIFIRLFCLLFSFVMLLLNILSIKEPSNLLNPFYGMLFLVLSWGMIIFFLVHLKENYHEAPANEWISVGVIIVTGIALRLFAMYTLKTVPTSDFATPHSFYNSYMQNGPYAETSDWASKDKFQLYYSRFPAWFPYMKIISFIYNVFGVDYHYILLLNLLLFSITALIVHLIGRMIGNAKVGVLAAMLFAWNPSMILYSCITTPDHFSALFMVLIAFFWIISEKHRYMWMKSKKVLLYPAAAAAMTAMMGFFKPVAPLVIVAFCCYEFAVYIYPALRSKMKLPDFGKMVVAYEAYFLVVLCLFCAVSNGILKSTVENTVKTRVVNSTGLYLYWGFATDEAGNYDTQAVNKRFIDLLAEYNNDHEKVFAIIDEESKAQLIKSIPHIPKIMVQKIQRLSSEYLYWEFSNASGDKAMDENLGNTIRYPVITMAATQMCVLYILSGLFMLLSAIRKKVSKPALQVGLLLFGYIAVLLISGVQGRYKSIIIPLWCTLSAYCAVDCFSRLERCIDSRFRSTRFFSPGNGKN